MKDPTTVRARKGSLVDVDRGARLKRHKDGTYVCMYEDDPGVFFDSRLNSVTQVRAKEAGYDLKVIGLDKKKLAAKKQAMEEIEAKFAEYDGLDEEDGAKPRVPAMPAVGGPTKPDPSIVIPEKPRDDQQQAASLFGEGAICNSNGQLRETPDLLMVHVSKGKFKLLDKKTNQPIEGGEMVTGTEGCELMLRHHDVK